MRRLVHISDLHFGRLDRKAVAALEQAIFQAKPHVVVVSGDVTQRALKRQFREAAAFLSRIQFPKVVVPGNHDIPFYNIAARFFSPLARYRRYIHENVETVYEDEEILVVGANTPKPYPIDAGRLTQQELGRLLQRLRNSPPEKRRIVVSHYPLDLFGGQKKQGKGRVGAKALLPAAPDLLLSGHLHRGSAIATVTLDAKAHRSFVLVQGGTSTSTRYRGECNTFNVIRVESQTIEIEKHEWSLGKARFEFRGRSYFTLSAQGWVPSPAPSA